MNRIVHTLLEFLVSWVGGSFAAYLLLFAYESFRPHDYTKPLDAHEKKQIAWTIGKLSIQAGFVIALCVYAIRHAR